MQQPELRAPRFAKGSYGERAKAFFTDGHPWTPSAMEYDVPLFIRTVTWARAPYCYWVEQTAEQSETIFKRPVLRHKMFQVALLSTAGPFDGLREFERWFIYQPKESPEYLAHIQQSVKDPDVEAESGDFADTFNFVFKNGLCAPNAEDLQKLDAILEQGYMDGYEVMQFKH